MALRTVYANTKKLPRIFDKPERPIKDKNGALVAAERQIKRWVEYCEELLKRPTPKDPVDIQPASYDLPIVFTVPTKEEIQKAIILLKNDKAAGPNDIKPEALKVDIETSMEMFYRVLEQSLDLNSPIYVNFI